MSERCEPPPEKYTRRFWAKVVVKSPNECWPWRGANRNGYGDFWLNGTRKKATHIAWQIAVGAPFPAGKHACHTCDNPSCVNPAHIWAGTHAENHRDCYRKGRSVLPAATAKRAAQLRALSECKQGHPFSPENTLINKRGYRQCRVCTRSWKAAYDQKRRNARAALTPEAAP